MSNSWLGVVSAEHVARGHQGGFMQVNHGKLAPLRRIKPGDLVAYYSPSAAFGGKDKLQSFTAMGRVKAGEPYEFDMGDGFVPYRRDVEWFEADPAPIHPLLEALEFTRGKRNWGYAFRFGLLTITEADMALIAHAMHAKITATPSA